MNKSIKTILGVLFWSIISAAFIGPGTVATAAKSGATNGLTLLWALLFSVIATIVLQEASSRITIGSGKNLGKIISGDTGEKTRINAKLIFLAIAFGCAAYQSGNILGAIAGVGLFADVPKAFSILTIGIICFLALWKGNIKRIAQVLGIVVALMGLAFIWVAFQIDIQFKSLFRGLLIPSINTHNALLVIALIGTTIVPYNLFLGSGISKGQGIGEMRKGLIPAIILGGIFSMAILVVGSGMQGEFSFEQLFAFMEETSGTGMARLFAIGLFIAGLSSSITCPLAAAITAGEIFKEKDAWKTNGRNFRIVWISILLIGLIFGISGIKPIPAIIMAQAINGFILPVIAIVLFLKINDLSILSKAYVNNKWQNIVFFIVVWAACFLGIYNLVSAGIKAIDKTIVLGSLAPLVYLIISLFIVLFVAYKIRIKEQASRSS